MLNGAGLNIKSSRNMADIALGLVYFCRYGILRIFMYMTFSGEADRDYGNYLITKFNKTFKVNYISFPLEEISYTY